MVQGRVPEWNALERLRNSAPPELSHAALMAWTIAWQMPKASVKLGEQAPLMLFDSDGLQMASGSETSNYHADILKEVGTELVIDACAGIGADAIAFARAGLNVIACELNPIRCEFLKANILALGLERQVECVNADAFDLNIPANAAIFLDPPRRSESSKWGGQDLADAMMRHFAAKHSGGLLVKLSPAADLALAQQFDASMEIISSGGECKEALLRFGSTQEGIKAKHFGDFTACSR